MKRYLLLLLFSCNCLATAWADGVVLLHGKIQNPTNDSIYISYNNSRLTYDPIEQGILLNKDGSFSTSLAVTEKFTPVSLRHGGRKAEFVAEPGNDLELIADGKNFDSTLHFKGTGEEAANFVALHTKERGLMETFMVKMQPKFSDTASVFKKAVADAEQDEVTFLNNHMTGIPASFIQYWTSYYHFFSYFCLMQYPLLHEVGRQKTYYVKNIHPSNYAAISGIPEVFNDSLLGIPPYRLFADQLYKMKLSAAGFDNVPEDEGKRKYRQDDSVISLDYKKMPSGTGEYAIASIIYANARRYPLGRTEQLFAAYKTRWPNSVYIIPIERQIAVMKRLAKGQKAMDFPINTPQGGNTKLSELKGKVVLLTFWSSAYELGMLDLRLTSKLFNKYKDSAVAFVYVSIDANDEIWKAAIQKNRLSGMHTRIDGWKSMLAGLYGIQGVPTFFLIDKKGNFAVDNVPLPRFGEGLSNEIARLLRE